MHDVDVILEKVLTHDSILKLMKNYIQNLLHTIRYNKNRDVFKDFTDQAILKDEFETDFNDLTYQMWINSLDLKLHNLETTFKQVTLDLMVLENKKEFNELQKSYINVKLNEHLLTLQNECNDIAEFIYFINLPKNEIDMDLYIEKKHKWKSIFWLSCLVFPYFIYIWSFKRKIKNKKEEIKEEIISFYNKHYFKISNILNTIKVKNDLYFVKHGLVIELIEKRIKETKEWLINADKIFKKFNIKKDDIKRGLLQNA